MREPTVRAISFAQHLAKDLAAILDDDLLGVYLHGSGATNCFNPDRSDIDLLVVAQETLPPEQRRAVAELLLASSGAPYPVELTLLTSRQLRPWRHPTPVDFHYSESWRQSLTQQLAAGELSSHPLTDPDLAAHITAVRARGRVLVGAPIDDVFPEVPAADFRQVILADLDWIRHHSTTIYGCSTPAGSWPTSTARAAVQGRGGRLGPRQPSGNLPGDDLQGAFGLSQRQRRAVLAPRGPSLRPLGGGTSDPTAAIRPCVGPCWVRNRRGNHGQQRTRVVTRRSQKPQVARPTAP
jgi:hypothetical protein